MLRSNNSSSSSLAQMNVSASSSSFFSSPHSSSARPSASSASWMPSILPVQALEDTLADELKLEPEVAEEVNENSDLDAAAEDRKMPLAFNSHRHTDDIVGPLPGERSSQTWRNRYKAQSVRFITHFSNAEAPSLSSELQWGCICIIRKDCLHYLLI